MKLGETWIMEAREKWDDSVSVRPYSLQKTSIFGEGMVAVKEEDGKVFITNEYGVFIRVP